MLRSSAGLTKEFEVGVGLYQGSALSPFLFAIVMDKLTEEIQTESPWDMMFADDIVLCREDRRQLQEVLEVWRNALEKRGLKVSRSKTEYMQAGGVDDGGELRLQEETVKVEIFKYLGSMLSRDGSCEGDQEKDPSRMAKLEEDFRCTVRDRKLSARGKDVQVCC